MSRSRLARGRATGAIALVVAVSSAALVPVGAAVADPITADFGDEGLVAAGWTGPGATTSDYDFEAVDGDTLRASNWTSTNDRGVITQLLSPTTDPAGEPYYTDADDDVFTIDFTLDSALEGADRYDAQPGLALELNADQAGNRAGGGLTLRVPADGVLELSNYYSLPEDEGEIWRNAVAEVPFSDPVDIEYTVRFVAGGADIVTVSVDGDEVLEGGSSEGYTEAASGHAGVVDGVLLRAVSREPGDSPASASWNNITLSGEQNAALKGKGLLFSDLSYGAGSSEQTVEHTVLVQKSTITSYENSVEGTDGFNYDQWHAVRADDDDPADAVLGYAGGAIVLNDEVRNGRSVQLLKGYASDARPTDLFALVAQGISWDQPATSEGEAYFQLPVFRLADDAWSFAGTLRPVAAVIGHNAVDLGDSWVSTRSFGDYVANTPAPLAEIIEALGAHYEVAGFGVASSGAAAGTAVSAITIGGTRYTFANDSKLIAHATISGVTKVGELLTASATANYPGVSFGSYQWYRDGKAISGAKSATYRLTSADLSKAISVKVTASRSGLSKVTATSAKTAKIGKGVFAPSGAPTIGGELKVGKKLTAQRPAYGLANVKVSYQWYRGSTAISGAKASTYTAASADLGKQLKVKVTASKTGYTSLAQVSSLTSAIEEGTLTVSRLPKITGTAKVGKTLTASSLGWSTTGVTKKYIWFADGELVQYSNSAKLVLTWQERGARITVLVLGAKPGYQTAESDFSSTTGVVK